jgi:hypothetical protein
VNGATYRQKEGGSVTLGVRLTETDRFGYSVPQQIRFLGLVAPIGSKVNSEPRLFGFG